MKLNHQMKSCLLLGVVSLLAAPLISLGQTTVFNDTFASGTLSTLNPTAASPGTLSGTQTAYCVGSSKNATGTTIVSGTPGALNLECSGTSSGYLEAQALFTNSPITLNTAGQYIEVYYTFVDRTNFCNGLCGNNFEFGIGLFNSAGSAPTNGANLWNGGFSGTTATNGGCQNWVGYNAQFAFSSNSVQSSAIATRPAQTGTNNLNQGLGYNSGYASGANVTTMTGVVGQPLLTVGSQYTMSVRITYVNPTTFAITNTLYNGAGNGGTIYSAGGWTGQFGKTVTPNTNSFNGLVMNYRPSASPQMTNQITGVTVVSYVPAAPSIAGLTNQTVVQGNNATLSATANGTPTPTLQWYYATSAGAASNAIAGATSSALTLTNVQYTQNGYVYYLSASNSLGTLTSNLTLSVIVPPSFALADQLVSPGTTVAISATSIGGVPTPAYFQWQTNGVNLADGATGRGSTIAGSTTGTLYITNAQTGDSGKYYLIVTNTAGMVTNSMTLTVASSSVAPTISGLTNQTVLAGNNATLSASVSGIPAPAVQWYYATGAGAVSNAIAGATSASLTLTNVQYSQNGYVYYLYATNSAGAAISNMTLSVTQIAPTITGLTNQTVNARFNVTFAPTIGGAPAPAGFQWKANGTAITGATNASLTLTNVQLLQNGYVYSLTATNTAGITTSNLTLTVTNALFNVQLNSFATTYSGVGQIGAAGDKWNNPALSGVNGMFYSSNAPPTTLASGVGLVDSRGVSSPVTFSMTGSNYVYSTGGTVSGNGVVAGLNDHFLKFDYTGNGTPVATISLAGLPPSTSLNLFGYGAIAYSGAGGTWAYASTNGGASAVIGWPAGTSSAMDLTQATNQGNCWMKITGTTDSGGNLTVKLTPNAGGDWWQVYLDGFQVQLHTQPLVTGLTNLTVVQGNNATLAPIVTGTPAPAFQWQTNGVNISGATNSTLNLNNVQYAQNGYVYSLISTNMAGAVTNSMTLTVIVTPSITGLANQAITVTSNTTISATVGGVPTPVLQWQLNGTNLTDGLDARGSTISGSTSSSLGITNSQIADTGTYSLIASNGAGIVTNSMTLTVSAGTVGPSITGLANQTAVQGSNAAFTASVSGLPVPALQWLDQTGAPIAGATSSTLTLTNVSYSQNGYTYSLVASNSAGEATNSATLTVLVPASISTQPQNLVVTNTQSASFSVVAGGVPAPAYQWYFNGSAIPAATATNYSIASAAPTNTGNYTVVVSNSVNVVTSFVATLTVNSTMGYTSLTPSNNATGVCYDTPLYISFTVAPTLRAAGTIKIYNITNPATPVDTIDLSQCVTNNAAYAANVQPYTIGGQTFTNFPVIITGTSAAIYPHQGLLTSNQTYYVKVDNGTFTDGNGAYFAGLTPTNAWQFTTKVGGPLNATNLVVAQDYSGDFATVQGAVNFVPSGNTVRTVINIHNGTYTEIVNVSSRNNLDLRGQSRAGTMIGYPDNNNLNPGAPWRACFVLNGNDCTLETLTLTNMTPYGGSQAEAIDVEGTRAILYNINLDSHQDTFLVHSAGKLVYFQDSLVQGDTDFNWGYGTVYYTNCEIRSLTAGGDVTQPRSPYTTNGFGFINCRITKGYTGSSAFYLGRTIGTPSSPSEVLFANCLMDDVVSGYYSDAGTNMADYACSNLTATSAKTLLYSTHSTSSDPYVIAIQSASTWLYGWQPALAPNITNQPAGQSVSHGQTASFAAGATGIPAPAYQWLLNGSPIAGATGATYTIPGAARTNGGNYSVVVTNGSGSVTSSVAVLSYLNTAPVAQIMIVSRTAGLSLKISQTDLSTNWSDVDGDPVTLSDINLVTTNGVNLVTNSGWIIYTNSPNVNDQISYGISDNYGGTSIGYINIVISSSVTGTNSITGIITGATNVVTAYGIPGYNYILERATNLAPAVWIDVSTNTTATNGVINAVDAFNDLGNVPPESAYYRLQWQP